jgi:hypothetical protein
MVPFNKLNDGSKDQIGPFKRLDDHSKDQMAPFNKLNDGSKDQIGLYVDKPGQLAGVNKH